MPWDTCLTTTANASPLTLAVCNETDPRQHFTVVPAANVSYFQLRQHGKCVSSITSGPPPAPPPPPPPPVPDMPPVANLFHDQQGAEIIVITSPGVATNGTAVVTVRGAGFTSALKASAIRPGESAPSALDAVRVKGVDIVVTMELNRGAAVVKLTS